MNYFKESLSLCGLNDIYMYSRIFINSVCTYSVSLFVSVNIIKPVLGVVNREAIVD